MQQSQQYPGIFIVLEGTDGSGKSTQYSLLKQRLEDEGHDVVTMQFPRYKEPSSYFVREYLEGNYGDTNEVGPYTASLFYALDRYQASRDIKDSLAAGKTVLCDRFVGANMAHQGAKFQHAGERRGYFIWLDNLEFEMLGIPRPTLTFVLNTPYDVVKQRLDAKIRSSTAIKKDIHEADASHIQHSIEVYLDLCQLFPKDFLQIDCTRDDKLLSIEAVHKLLWGKITPLLPEPSNQDNEKGIAMRLPDRNHVSNEQNPYIDKVDGHFVISEAGQKYLQSAVTNTTDDVYAFTEMLNPMTIAAAMARLSRRGDDMRVTLLDEFANNLGKDEQLLQRVITAYGDDSVQQLAGQHVVVENASNLLTKKLEWGRLAAYLEQSTRYIYFDQKDQDGKYKYFVPEQLDNVTKLAYCQRMDKIFELYSTMVRSLTEYVQEHSDTPEAERDGAWKGATRAQACDTIRAVLPVATKSTVGIFASGQALESLILHLQADELSESKVTGQKILDEARKVVPTLLERADKPERGGAMVAYKANTAKQVQNLVDDYLSDTHPKSRSEAVQLTDVWPRNELDLVADMIYEHSDLPLSDLRDIVSRWPYQQKVTLLEAYIGERLNRRHRPGRALEKAHYSWDIVCDYGIFRDLQRHRIVDDLEWQQLTPRYGFEVPKLVEEAGLSDMFEQCFNISLELHSLLLQAGYVLEAQYATLLGHKMRWKVTYNAREAFHLHELRTSPQGHTGYRKLLLQMHAKLAEVHPLLAAGMTFVNSDEDPVLTRLAGERYTQFKLAELDKLNAAISEKSVDSARQV